MKLTQREFLLQHLCDGKKYQEIGDDYNEDRLQLSEWWETGTELREKIKRANQLFNSRIKNPDFKSFLNSGKRAFFEWFEKQPSECGYCGIEENKLEALFSGEKPTLETKRRRGAKLELERRDSGSNEYSEENCIMACYLCNNHKSDLISEEDHKQYFAPKIRQYLEDKFQEKDGKQS
ncbi:MAG: hypothetical protein JXR10_06925 [Cyclobacteriaceae bacterium]